MGRLFITANKGQTWQGDIAIDDLHLYTDVCSNVVGACFGNPCQNGGTCTETAQNQFGYTCSCMSGFAGFDCQLKDASTESDLFCGFEDNQNCIFQNDFIGDIPWTRRTGETPSSGTGPLQANEGVYYRFLEASSPQVQGEKAILSTWNSQLASSTVYCLKFYYHMLGIPGSLSVKVGERFGQTSTLWTISGNQGDQWKEQEVQIDSSYTDPEIFIIATRGTSWQGDIAVDSISLKKETCQSAGSTPCSSNPCVNAVSCTDNIDNTFTCVCQSGWTGPTCETVAVLSTEYKCDFEDGQSCIFTNTATDDFNWSRKSGSTPTANTGPTAAYTGTHYIYTEVSSPVNNRAKAIITTENTQLAASDYCLSMAYHRKGNLGPLIVRAGERGSTLKEEWRKTGSQGGNWQTVSIHIPFYSDPVIEVEGKKARSIRGDMALDDVILKEGPCVAAG